MILYLMPAIGLLASQHHPSLLAVLDPPIFFALDGKKIRPPIPFSRKNMKTQSNSKKYKMQKDVKNGSGKIVYASGTFWDVRCRMT